MIPLDLPAQGVRVRGYLQTRDDDLELLREGLLHVTVSDYAISVDWLDEHDPDGEYVVTEFRGDWDDDDEINYFTTRDPQEVKRFVEVEVRRLVGQQKFAEASPFVPFLQGSFRLGSTVRPGDILDVLFIRRTDSPITEVKATGLGTASGVSGTAEQNRGLGRYRHVQRRNLAPASAGFSIPVRRVQARIGTATAATE